MRTSYNNISTFRAVLCTAFLLAVSIINCNAESPSDDMAPLARELRVIVDLYRLLSDKDLDNTLKEYVLVNISVKGVATETGMAYDTDLKRAVKHGNVEAGTFANGDITILGGLSGIGSAKTMPFRIPLNPYGRGEESKRFSPYLMLGGLALCKNLKPLESTTITQFPETLVLPVEIINHFTSGEQRGELSVSLMDALNRFLGKEVLDSIISGRFNPEDLSLSPNSISSGLFLYYMFAQNSLSIEALDGVLARSVHPDVIRGLALATISAVDNNLIETPYARLLLGKIRLLFQDDETIKSTPLANLVDQYLIP